MAILQSETEAERLLGLIAESDARRMSTASYVELGVVADRARNPRISRSMDLLLDSARIELEPVTVGQARIARAAHARFGRGSGSPARLNYGDCFAYALAKDLEEALLFKGDDFVHTDIEAALA